MSGRVARRLTVHGRVQGVFFRATVSDAAVAAGASGWAANHADGTVEVWAEGSAVTVEPQGLDGFTTR